MDSDSETGAQVDGATKQQIVVSAPIDSMVSHSQSAGEVPHRDAHFIKRDIANYWRECDQSQVSPEVTGLDRGTELH
jgi:hypothetical protein